jgi:hypothetical protein
MRRYQPAPNGQVGPQAVQPQILHPRRVRGRLRFTRFFGAAGVTGLNLYSRFVAIAGAIIVLVRYHLIFRRRAF